MIVLVGGGGGGWVLVGRGRVFSGRLLVKVNRSSCCLVVFVVFPFVHCRGVGSRGVQSGLCHREFLGSGRIGGVDQLIWSWFEWGCGRPGFGPTSRQAWCQGGTREIGVVLFVVQKMDGIAPVCRLKALVLSSGSRPQGGGLVGVNLQEDFGVVVGVARWGEGVCY